MRNLTFLVACLLSTLSIQAKLTFQEIRTASNNVIELFFTSDTLDVNEVDISNPSDWKVNGQQVLAINRTGAAADMCDHFVYLTVPTLKNGNKYSIETPYGKFQFKFNDKDVYCEAIKTNQVAYSSLSAKRFANFAIYLGDGGSKKIEGPRPGILVFGAGNYVNNYPSYPVIRRGQTPRERAYIDVLDNYQNNEYTIYQSLCFPSVVYPILAGGCEYGPKSKDPYKK